MKIDISDALENWLEIGQVVSAHGLQGELKVNSTTDFPERFVQIGDRLLVSPDRHQQQVIKLLKGRYLPGKNQYVIRLEGIETRSQAEALHGYILMVNPQEEFSLEKDEYHISQLINLSVYLQSSQQFLGTVVNVFFAGNDLLEVQLSVSEIPRKPKTVLIPFVKEIVPYINLDEARIEIDPPAGLLDL